MSELLDGGAMWVVYHIQVWEMSSSAWRSELEQEGVEHHLPNDYLVSLTPTVFNYGVELELPRVCLIMSLHHSFIERQMMISWLRITTAHAGAGFC